MTERVMLKYIGNKKDLHLKMPWLAENVLFADAKNRIASVLVEDAREILRVNPKGFELARPLPGATEDALFSDEGLEGDDVANAAEEAPEGEPKRDAEAKDEKIDDTNRMAILESVRGHMAELPSKRAIIEFAEKTYGVSNLSARDNRDELIEAAAAAIARQLEG